MRPCRILAALAVMALAAGCITGEGNRQYVWIDELVVVGGPMPEGFLNQRANSETGRDRSQKADATGTLSLTGQ
jgi:hypothetical protein